MLSLARRDDMNKHLPEISNGGGLLHDDCVSLRNTALQIAIIDIRGFPHVGDGERLHTVEYYSSMSRQALCMSHHRVHLVKSAYCR